MTDVIIVGAGPAGLAVAACLQRSSLPFLLLERDHAIAPAWQRHYARLHLHTHKRWSALPYLPFPRDYPAYPSRDQFVAYLEAYTRHFELQPRLGEAVTTASYVDEQWHIATNRSTYRARHLVIATGLAGQPIAPHWPGQEAFQGRMLHSSAYIDGTDYSGTRVLVVGFGNSGGEIALDLLESGAHPTLSVRGPVNILPRDVLGIPGQALTIPMSALPAPLADLLAAPLVRMTVGRVQTVGLRQAAIGPFEQIHTRGRIPLIDVGTLRHLRSGAIAVRPAIERFSARGVVFVDGRQDAFDTVILATGYRPALPVLRWNGEAVAVDAAARPDRERPERRPPHLYLCGFQVSSAGMLRTIAQEAQAIARRIRRTVQPAA